MIGQSLVLGHLIVPLARFSPGLDLMKIGSSSSTLIGGLGLDGVGSGRDSRSMPLVLAGIDALAARRRLLV